LAAANYSLVLSSTDAGKGMTNASIAVTTRKFRERMTWFKLHGADVEITSPAIDAVDTLANLDREGVQQLFRLFVGSSATSLGTFDPARASEAKDIIEKHWPLATAYSERVDVTAPQVRIGKVSMSAASINMDLQLAHAEDGDNSALNFTVDKPVLAPGLYPHAFELAMPDSVAVGMRFTGLRIQDFLTASLSARDQTGDGNTDNWLSRLYLSGDTTRFEFVNTAVKSQYYEAEVSGWLSGDFKSPTPGRPECDLTITARNLDKTVAFLQANANSVPQFGQASFVLLMAKGMAKQRADGSLVWHIQIDKVGRRFINGRKIGR
jgi:hypothetical protein